MKTFAHIRTFEQLDTAWVMEELPVENSRKWKELYTLMHLLDTVEDDDYFYDLTVECEPIGVDTFGYLTLNNQYVSLDVLRDHITLAEEDGNYFAYVEGEGYKAKIYPVNDYCDLGLEKITTFNKQYRMRYLDDVAEKYHFIANMRVWGYKIEAETDNLYKVSYTCLNHKNKNTKVSNVLSSIYHLAHNKVNEKDPLDRAVRDLAKEIF